MAWCVDTNVCRDFKVGFGIRAKLMADETLNEYVHGNIYPIVAPEPKTGKKDIGDFIVYRREKYTRLFNNFGAVDEASVTVSCISESYDNSVMMAELVDELLSGEISYDECTWTLELIDAYEDYTDYKYVQSLTFKIKN